MWRPHHALILAALVVGGGLAHAQALPVSGQGQAQTNPCNGPLAALIPACQQAGSSPLEPATPLRLPSVHSPVPAARSGTAGATTPAEAATLPPTTPAEPEPPTDFQLFVASSTGKVLPIYGANLFTHLPTTFAPVDRVPVTADYVVGPGDQILLRVWGQVNLDLELTVDRAGSVYIPQVGNVNVSGLQFQQLSGYLRTQLERFFRNFDLSVNLGQLRSIQIFVVGEARRPGTYTVSSLSTLVTAIFASGGPSNQGSMRHIQLKRTNAAPVDFDLYDLLMSGDKSRDTRLLPGDVLYVPPAGPRVAVAGSVRTPAIYELKAEHEVGDLIRMAGGLSAMADTQHATLERIHQSASREVLEFKLDSAGLATAVSDGDLLNIEAILPRFGNAVTLRGNVANPGRIPWHAGMRLRDVIPDKESLLTRDYWRKRNLLGFVAQEVHIPGEPAMESTKQPAATAAIAPVVPEINWSYAVIERQNSRDLKSQLIPFNLGKLVLDNDESQNLELQPGDVITVFSQADIRVPVSQQNPKVQLEGEFKTAGVYSVLPGETLGALIQRVGGITPQGYLYGSEFLRESTRIDQQRRLDQFVDEMERDLDQSVSRETMRAATPDDATAVAANAQSTRQLVARMRSLKATGRIVLHLDPGSTDVSKLSDLPLEDGDRFIVPPRPATVNVFGAVYNQSSFLFEPDMRVEDYLNKSGGGTRTADKHNVFIIRADGSIVPKQAASPFTRSFESERLNPGDSIVMPEQIFKPGIVRGLRDWTQVFSQLALGAAAIAVLR
jgi:protein involved in polysaccharide export with SLBB domain